MAHRLLVLQEMALREGTWEKINRALRERLRVRLKRDPQPSALGGQFPVGEEYRGGRGRARLRRRQEGKGP